MKQIDTALVGQLLAAQFPRWADLDLRGVEKDGWDNRTFRLGEGMTVRLPSDGVYAGQVEKEQRWLPRLAPHLPLPIPEPLAMGAPGEGYLWHWSVYRWLNGENATAQNITDLPQFAISLARFLNALQQIDPAEGPPPGPHNFFRGGALTTYDAETRDALSALRGRIDTDAASAVWEAALQAEWQGVPVWLHGDVSSGNLLVEDGRLCAVIDFGCLAVGDPACDLTIAWTLFSGESRAEFRATLSADEASWARARGWAIWKGAITLVKQLHSNPLAADGEQCERARCVIEQVLAEHLNS